MPSRKRTRAEMEAPEPGPVNKELSLLQRIRNMWEFSAVMQYVYLFGKVVKIDEDFDVEDFEEECLKPGSSDKLEEIGLTLLKWISSHRGLTYEIWDEYVRRQYLAKAPERNPYGEDEEPKKFRSFDIFQRIRILHQLTVWTFWNPDRIRERMPEHQKEGEQLEWRMEPFGWDSKEREYYILDDNRMYRRTEPLLPVVSKARPKSNTIKARAARRRASKRRKVDDEDIESDAPEDDETSQLDTTQVEENVSTEVDTYGGYTWECVAITLNDFTEFLESIKKTKDTNEKELRNRVIEDVLPVIEAAAEKQRRKQERRERELMLLEKMAGAKRSSRLADRQEREKKEYEEAETARRRAAELAAAHREQEKQQQMEDERRSRMMTRDQRIKDREYKRLLMEEELAQDAEEQKRIEEGEKRGSERHLRERIEKNRKELEDLEADEDWTFDCSGCGKYGKNYDDGSHSVACERCNVWQHSKCLGVPKNEAEKDDFHLVCGDCRKKEDDAKRPKIMLKFGAQGQSSSPPQLPSSPARPQQRATLVSVDIPKAPAFARPAQEQPTNSLQTAQSPLSRPLPLEASPRMPTSPGSAQGSVPSLQQPRQVPIHGPSSPPSRAINMASSQYPQQTPNGNTNPTKAHASQVPSHNMNTNRQPQVYSGQNVFGTIQSTPQPSSAQGSPNGSSTVPRRIPSPVLNPPTMSPTQGNPEVGPIAGVPGSSPSSYHLSLFTPNANGKSARPSSQEQQTNGYRAHRPSLSPRQSVISQTPNPQHLSGLSPVKQRVTSPLPPPSTVPEKQRSHVMSTPGSHINSAAFNANAHNTLRSVSGTPIFPPAEMLAPSPEQMNREPVPTPSKQPSPVLIDGEWRRVSSNGDMMQGVQMNGASGNQPQNTGLPLQSALQEQTTLGQNGQARQS